MQTRTKLLPNLIFLPLLILPLIHLPTGIRTLEALSVKMFFVLPAALLIFAFHKKKLSFNPLKGIILSIVLLNAISFLRFGGFGHPLQSLLTMFGFIFIYHTVYSAEHCVKRLGVFLKISIFIASITGGYSLIQQLGFDPLSLKTWDGISSTFPNRNFLAGYMSFSLLASVFLILKNKKNHILIITAAVIVGDALMLSQT